MEAWLNGPAWSVLSGQEAVTVALERLRVNRAWRFGYLSRLLATRQTRRLVFEIVVVAAASAEVELTTASFLGVEVPASFIVLTVANLSRFFAGAFVYAKTASIQIRLIQKKTWSGGAFFFRKV